MARLIVIPARFRSERLPGKLLRDDTGWPLIRHVHERCKSVPGVDRVIVAADGDRIRDAVEAFGGEVVVTDPDLLTGTDRVAEAVRALDLDRDRDLVVNVQGDEPEIDPQSVALVFERLAESRRSGDGLQVATLAVRRHDPEGWLDPNRVKVLLDRHGRALCFTRAPLPRPRGGEPPKEWLLHLGIYGFLPAALAHFRESAPGELERLERLEQLRFLEDGLGIAVEVIESEESVGRSEISTGGISTGGISVGGIDTEEDYRRFVERVKNVGGSPGDRNPGEQR
jgi:3-deoxy-manno-octulosonate cytidylyltransferase (CMP-KDO synthetase)